jgi:hypothetical protein
MDCLHVKVPEGTPLAGYTAAGQRVPIAPGEYLVHRWSRRIPVAGVAGEALRFVGADQRGRDVHVPLTSLAQSLGAIGSKTAEDILASAERFCLRISDSGHWRPVPQTTVIATGRNGDDRETTSRADTEGYLSDLAALRAP